MTFSKVAVAEQVMAGLFIAGLCGIAGWAVSEIGMAQIAAHLRILFTQLSPMREEVRQLERMAALAALAMAFWTEFEVLKRLPHGPPHKSLLKASLALLYAPMALVVHFGASLLITSGISLYLVLLSHV